jgi:formate dehydrogenase iron-sulfur subunit
MQTLIDDLLLEQQRFSPVERFARRHQHNLLPAHAKHYRELLPQNLPAQGQQYAFSVDIDACSGCKACVAACHSLNGLDEEETWRTVGLLHGGTTADPVQITVTTSCHHCIEPGCLEGCPVLAYEKDPITGIVRHLDDQCIGCQYCILKCPYDAPKYSRKRGIVRKCDMCTSRLAAGEAPACAQACPNAAISIVIIDKEQVAQDAIEGKFLTGGPDPQHTLPTTRYITQRVLPENLIPADQQRLHPEHAHPPLVLMLVLTQLSVGAFCADVLLRRFFPGNLMMQLSAFHSGVAVVLGLLALAASTFHLGRPLSAWRSVIGLKTSWLSREIVVFGIFAVLALVQAASFWVLPLWSLHWAGTGAPVAVTGLLGVFCSVMIYQATRRPGWNGAQTAIRFFGSTIILGSATVLFLTTMQAWLSRSVAAHGAYFELTHWLSRILVIATVLKLVFEARVLRHVLERDWSPEKRTALLLTGELRELSTARLLAGLIGGLFMPLALLLRHPAPGLATLGVTLWLLLFVVASELLERHLFFAAVSAPKMPGGITT